MLSVPEILTSGAGLGRSSLPLLATATRAGVVTSGLVEISRAVSTVKRGPLRPALTVFYPPSFLLVSVYGIKFAFDQAKGLANELMQFAGESGTWPRTERRRR